MGTSRPGRNTSGVYFPLANNKVAIFGDSITNNCTSSNGTENYGYLFWAKLYLDQRFTFDVAHNFGVGGDKTWDLLARIGPVLACDAATVILLIGTNDSANSLGVTTGVSTYNTLTNLESIVSQLTAAGKLVVLVPLLPRGDAANTSNRLTTSQGQIYRHFAAVQWCRAQNGRRGVRVADAWPTMAVAKSTTGDVIAGITIDGLHPNTLGAAILGRAIADALLVDFRQFVSPAFTSSIDLYDVNYNPNGCFTLNPLMEGTGGTLGSGGSLGSAGNGYTAGFSTSWTGANSSATNITRTYYKDANDALRCVIGGTGDSSGPAVDICRQSSLHTIAVAGRDIEAVADIDIKSGASNIISVQVGFQATLADASTVYTYDGDRYLTSSPFPSDAIHRIWRSPKYRVPAGLTNLYLRTVVYFAAGNVTPYTPALDLVVNSCGARHV